VAAAARDNEDPFTLEVGGRFDLQRHFGLIVGIGLGLIASREAERGQ
jgi:hypothetical protein